MTYVWLFNGKELIPEEIPSKSIGFVYKITNKDTGKWYIGRKMLTKAATKVVNGKKKKLRKDSDWMDYWSSSPFLLEEMEKEGKEKYVREILMFVDTKAALTYAEEYLLYVTGSLFDPMCYNSNIRSKIFRTWFAKTPTLHSELQALKL